MPGTFAYQRAPQCLRPPARSFRSPDCKLVSIACTSQPNLQSGPFQSEKSYLYTRCLHCIIDLSICSPSTSPTTVHGTSAIGKMYLMTAMDKKRYRQIILVRAAITTSCGRGVNECMSVYLQMVLAPRHQHLRHYVCIPWLAGVCIGL